MTRFITAASSALLLVLSVSAEQKVEPLPAPKESSVLPPPKEVIKVPMGPLGPVLPGYILPDRYAHWQYYARDQQGYLKPRVIIAPQQSYYLYNGMPYRFLPTNPQVWSKNITQ